MQKGFIFPSLYIYLGIGLIVLILGALLKVQSSRLESCKAEHQAFVSKVETLGLEAKAKAKQQEALDKLKKEKADEDLRKLRIANSELSKRLRDNAGSSFVPSTGSVTGKPEIACFNQSSIDSAIKRFAERAAGITEQGQSAVDDLNNAKRWANQ